MGTPQRAPGLFGRREPKRHPAIPFRRIWSGAPVQHIPDHPEAVDTIARVGGGWKLLGNGPDPSVFPGFPGCGCCVSVTRATWRRLLTAIIRPPEHYPPWSEVLAFYKTQNPDFDPYGGASTGPGSDADGGMDIQTALEYLQHSGEVAAFAAVDAGSEDEVKAAIAIGGAVWTGIRVQAVNQEQFAAGQPWDWQMHGRVEGLHSVLTGGYGPPGTGALAGDERMQTWAAETSFTDSYWEHGVEECWFVIWAEQLGNAQFAAGIDGPALAAAFTAVTGRPFPAPPAPAPDPQPAPAPADPVDLALWRAAGPWVVRGHHRAPAHELADVRDALAAWAEAKHLAGA